MRPTSLIDEALKHVTNKQLQKAHRKTVEKADAGSIEARKSTTDDAKYTSLMNRVARHEGARDEVEERDEKESTRRLESFRKDQPQEG